MPSIMEAMQQQIIIGDGAMGTMLQGKGLPAGESPEVWMLSNQDKILDVMTAYVKAGAGVIESNTFGANRLKLAEFGHGGSVSLINATAVSLAKEAAGPSRYVAGVIGPSGRFPAPVGDVPFEELIDVFAQQAQSLSLSGADLILLQTFSDLGEARAAYLGARKVTNLPVAVSLTFDHRQRTLTGTDPETAAAVFSALGADLLGVNCSTGPAEMLSIVSSYRKRCNLPLLAEPNAGMPVIVDGRSTFPLTPEGMAPYVPLFLESGVRYLGGCCGTTPTHIKEIAEAVISWKGKAVPVQHDPAPSLASRSKTIYFGPSMPPRLIGERLNPTARKVLSQAIAAGDFDVFAREGKDQIEAGADLLDVNVGVAGSDEAENMPRAVLRLQQSIDCPLALDSVNPEALEKALIQYQGKALINSVNGEESSLGAILPLAKRYGAAVLGLTLDGHGVPDHAEGRLQIAVRILERAIDEGIPKEDVFIDCLAMAAAAGPRQAAETLRAIALVKEKLGLVTVLGLSNISHGMPSRSWLNQAFLAQALAAGLDAVIANPLDAGIRKALAAGAFLAGRDPHGARYIAQAKKEGEGQPSLYDLPASVRALEPLSLPTPASAFTQASPPAAMPASEAAPPGISDTAPTRATESAQAKAPAFLAPMPGASEAQAFEAPASALQISDAGAYEAQTSDPQASGARSSGLQEHVRQTSDQQASEARSSGLQEHVRQASKPQATHASLSGLPASMAPDPGNTVSASPGPEATAPVAVYSQSLLLLQQAIVQNDRQQIRKLLQPLIHEMSFIELVDQSIVPALGYAGDSFSRGETFLPQLLLSADGASFTFDYLRIAKPSSAQRTLETVVLGTVAGDVHDIGKNIVKALLNSYGYQVVDLGKSVPVREFVKAVKEHNAQILGLSALMTTTMTEMEQVIRAIRYEGLDTRILVGGAALTREYAESIRADAYVKDAAEAHGVIRRLLD